LCIEQSASISNQHVGIFDFGSYLNYTQKFEVITVIIFDFYMAVHRDIFQ